MANSNAPKPVDVDQIISDSADKSTFDKPNNSCVK